jgi:hypothetical protein
MQITEFGEERLEILCKPTPASESTVVQWLTNLNGTGG